MRWEPSLARLLASWLACGLMACAGTGSTPSAGTLDPAVWHARNPGSGGVLFLLGSVHIGTDAMRALGGVVDEAFDRAEELVVEVDVTRLPESEATAMVKRYAELRPPQRLPDLLSPSTRQMLAEYLTRRNLDAAMFESLKPWFAAMLVTQVEFRQAGYQFELGVDYLLLERAQGHKPVVGLETMESQFELLDRLPAPLQELMLKDALARVDHLQQEVAGLIEAWERGDEAALEKLLFSAREEYPEIEPFYDRVFFERNENMASQLAGLAADGRTRLVVLGAGHMVGDRGVPALLARRGYRVERLRSFSKKASSRAGGPAAMPVSISVFSWLYTRATPSKSR